MKHIWLSIEQAAAVTGWSERHVRRLADEGSITARAKEGKKSKPGPREREYCASSLPADAQLKIAHLNLSGAKLGAPGGQLSGPDANQRGELTAPSSLYSSTQGFLFSPPPVIPEDQRLLLSAADLATAEERLNAIAPMLDFKNGTAAAITVGGKTISNLDDLAAYLAAQRSLSARTLWDWYSRFRKHGFAALADRLRSDRGKSRFFKQHPKAAEWIQDKYLNKEKSASVEAIYYALKRDWPTLYNHGSVAPGYTTVRNYLKTIPRALKVLARDGEKAFNNNLRPFVIRKRSDLAPNQIWVSDHMRHDVWVRNDCLPGLDFDAPYRLWLTAFMDERSRKITGMCWSVNPSSETILSALRVGIGQFGKPAEVYVDNGKDFKKIAKINEESPELSGALTRLGIRTRHALKYHAQSKSIESFFHTLHLQFDALFGPFYCGPSAERRPEDCDEVLAEHALFLKEQKQLREGKIQPEEITVTQSPLMPASEFIRIAAAWLVKEYNRKHAHSGEGMDGRAPDMVFNSLLKPADRLPCSPSEIAPLFWDRKLRTLQEGFDVKIDKRRYEPADTMTSANLAMLGERDREIVIACDPMNLAEAAAWTKDEKFLGFYRTKGYAHWNLTSEELREQMRQQNKLQRVSRDYLAGLARRNHGTPSELDVLRANAGLGPIVDAAPLPQLPAEATTPIIKHRHALAAAAAPDYSADVAERLRALREEGGD